MLAFRINPTRPNSLLTAAIEFARSLTRLRPTVSDAAEISASRTEPVVLLDNGVRVYISATIAESPEKISNIFYTLRAPANTRVRKITYSPGELGLKETMRFFDDSDDGTYETTTRVITQQPGISVRATSQVQGQKASVSGSAGQDLVAFVTR